MQGVAPTAAEVPVKVLAVDDDEKNLRALSALLHSVPATLVTARTGEEALRHLLRDDFAVVLLDLHMPGLNGLETAALVRERERSRRTPIIFLTAYTRNDAQLLHGYQLGAVDFLTKPVLPEEVLREKVAWFVEAHRQAGLLERARERALAAERRENERAVAEAKRRGEAEALRSEMERQQQLVRRLNRANERLQALSSLAGELLLAEAPAEHLQRFTQALATHLGLEVHLLHLSGEEGRLSLASHGGVSAEAIPEVERPSQDDRVFATAAMQRTPVVVDDLAGADGRYPALCRMALTAAACFPLVAGGRVLGTLTFGTRERSRFEPDELSALDLAADQVAMSLERARLVAELRRRAEDLAEADRRKDEFLAMLAHELRNPLAPVVSGLQILRDERATPAARRRALDASDRQVRHLVRLVDDLVDVSRIRTGKVELRRGRVDLARVVEDAAAAVEPLVKEHRHELAIQLPPGRVTLDGDAVRLTQVVENLLHNAAKYTDPGGRIRLEAEMDGSVLALRVTDDGIGMPADLVPRVFDIFVQGPQPASRARGGLGLGLALVKSLVEMHGGSVSVRSAGPGMGSTFEIRLPAARPEAQEDQGSVRPGEAPANGHGGSRLRIAVIEDNPDVRGTLRELLELGGHEVCEAEDGARGVDLVLALHPDVALVDIGLPGLDGYEVARRLRASGTRLVALTGYGGADDRSRAVGAGFEAHLVKPVEFEELAHVLDRLGPPIRTDTNEESQPCQSP